MGIFMLSLVPILIVLMYIAPVDLKIYPQANDLKQDVNFHLLSTPPVIAASTASIVLPSGLNNLKLWEASKSKSNENNINDSPTKPVDWSNNLIESSVEDQVNGEKQAKYKRNSAINLNSNKNLGDSPLGSLAGYVSMSNSLDNTIHIDTKEDDGGTDDNDVETFTNNHQSSNENSDSGHNSRHYNTYPMSGSPSSGLANQVHGYGGNNNKQFLHSHAQHHPSNLNYIHGSLAKPLTYHPHGTSMPSPFHYSSNLIQQQHHYRPHHHQSIVSNVVQDQTINSVDNNINLSIADLPGSQVCGRQQIGYREPRIVGGNSTFEGEFPWAISIQRHGDHHCGGVIVGKRWILTAAHCVRSQLVGSLIVRTGGHTLSRNGNHLSSHLERDYVVDQIVMHDDFSRYDNLSASQMKSSANTNNADIALLRLKHDIHWNELAWPVCFPNKESGNFSGHDAIVIGWGKLNEKSEDFSNELQKVKLTIIDNKVCQNWFRQAGREMPIDDRVICAGFKNGGKDACHGDSGGPLLSRINGQYVVVGVVSTGIGCARPLLPGLYSRVSSYIGWIERHITV